MKQGTAQLANTFARAGAYLAQHARSERSESRELETLNNRYYDTFEEVIRNEHLHNPWFTERFVRLALEGIARMLQPETLRDWLKNYPGAGSQPPKKIGVVMAGNIPLVGFHDFLCVLLSGNRFVGKTSSKDDRLLRKVAELLIHLRPGLEEHILFTDQYLKDVDAVIATGSDNTARYFEYYFRNTPHIIRKNRNGVAVLNGSENREDLRLLGQDVFTYFGLGCRNVTKLYVPENFDLTRIMEVWEPDDEIALHHKYQNNIEYHRAVYLMNSIPFLDNGGVLLKEDPGLSSPIGVVYYEKYSELERVLESLKINREQIQCTVSVDETVENRVKPGQSQFPSPGDYADGIDTMQFLIEMSHNHAI